MTTRPSSKPKVFTIQQLAPLLHLSRATITRIVRDTLKIKPKPYVWRGKRFQLDAEDVMRIIAVLRPSMRQRVEEAARETGILPSPSRAR